MRQRALPWHSFLPCHANRQQKHNCFLCQGPGNRYEAAKQLLYSPVFFHFQRPAVLFKCHHFFLLFPLEKLPRLVLWCCFTYVVQPGPAHVPLCIHQLSPRANKCIMCVISDRLSQCTRNTANNRTLSTAFCTNVFHKALLSHKQPMHTGERHPCPSH